MINLFQVLPNTFIQESLATYPIYKNLDALYKLDNEVRLALLDLLRLRKLKFFYGIIYAFGWNGYGQLGTGDIDNKAIPTPIDFSTIIDRDGRRKKVVQVSVGGLHSLILCKDGTVYSCGDNLCGRLGTGNTDSVLIPTKIDTSNIGNKKIIQVSAGIRHSLFLCEDGTVYACGDNLNGQLGTGNTNNVSIPTPINISNIGSKKIIQVSAGNKHSLILCEDGTVYSFGRGQYGELGDGTSSNTDDVAIPTAINTLNMDGKRVIQIAASSGYSLILCEDGTVYSFGHNQYGQLGTGITNNIEIPTEIDTTNIGQKQVIQVSAGRNYSLLLCEDGSVYSCGSNNQGQLGNGTTDIRNSVEIPTEIDTTNIKGKKMIQVTAGYQHSLILCDDGTVYSFGSNYYGQLGNGTSGITNNVTVPTKINASLMDGQEVIQVSAGGNHSLILT